jgi:glutaredoxin
LLSSWGVSFEGVDVEQRPEAMEDLKRLGIPVFPATIIGDRFVHGWNPKALAELVGVSHVEGERLSPDELCARLDRILAANQRAIRTVPAEGLDSKAPDRDRTLRSLAFHVFRLSAAFVDCREHGQFPEAWLLEEPPAEMRDGAAIAAYGQAVRDRMATFCARPGWCDGRVSTYYGAQTAHELMERTTWHAAQHVRQVYWFIERLGIPTADGLTEADLRGLPVPREVWS